MIIRGNRRTYALLTLVLIAILVYLELYPFAFRVPHEGRGAVHKLLEGWADRTSKGVDGKSIAVIIDTGAQHSVIDRQTALSIGVDSRALNGAPASSFRGIASGTGIEARQYRFRRLTIGREMIVDPTLLIAPLGLEDADLILGTDFLKARHVWMSYKSHKIVIARSDASGP